MVYVLATSEVYLCSIYIDITNCIQLYLTPLTSKIDKEIRKGQVNTFLKGFGRTSCGLHTLIKGRVTEITKEFRDRESYIEVHRGAIYLMMFDLWKNI